MAHFPSDAPQGGFTFDLCKRNAWLEASNSSGTIMKKAKKTGTTISGIVFKDGVVLGADTRATEGPIVADKNCEKIHYLAPNIFCCGAGTSADCDNVTEMMASNLTLHRLNTGRECRVSTAVTMLAQYLFRHQGHISAALVVGGVDVTGPSLFTVHPHGSVDQLPFVTMGSGSLAAMAVYEAGYQQDLNKEQANTKDLLTSKLLEDCEPRFEMLRDFQHKNSSAQRAVELVRASIMSGILNDLGSGSNCDITIITPGNVERFRNIDKAEPKYKSKKPLIYQPGTTKFYDEKVSKFKITVTEGEAMDE